MFAKLTRTVSAVTSNIQHSQDCSLIILPIKLTEFSSQCPRAVPLLLFVTRSTCGAESFNLLQALTRPQVGPLTPGPINDVPADFEFSVIVVGNYLVGQSLAPVGLLDNPNTELGFLVY